MLGSKVAMKVDDHGLVDWLRRHDDVGGYDLKLLVMDDNIGQLSWDTNSSRIQLIQKPNDDDGDVGYGGDDHVVDYDDEDGKGQYLIKSDLSVLSSIE